MRICLKRRNGTKPTNNAQSNVVNVTQREINFK